MDHKDAVPLPPTRVGVAQCLEREERGASAADTPAFRVWHNVPRNVARQMTAIGPMPDLLPVKIGLRLRARGDDHRRPPGQRRISVREASQVCLPRQRRDVLLRNSYGVSGGHAWLYSASF
jgi:hypothetical protein